MVRGRKIEIVSFLLLQIVVAATAANVTYDHRALVIDGKRKILISGSIHYPRSTPEMWPDLIQKSKDGGLDVIETYVFWNGHEPHKNKYNFEGRYDLVKFVKLVAKAGLYVHLRIGPYACAEWNYGGFPVWLHFIPGIKFRTDNEPFKAEMQRFTAKIVDLMKQERLYASQGGPIILSQVENEYGNVDSSYGAAGKIYMKWSASMALSLDTGVPWNMCQQGDAPDPIINTCNGFYCDQFTPNSNNKPKMWTENWSGWFLGFGDPTPYRPVEDLAFAVAIFYQRSGTFQNYYMYHGGTNFERTSGGPLISTSYDYDAPIDEYGLVRQPKWGHLRDLHKAIKLCEDALLATDPTVTSLGSNLVASEYKTSSGSCAAFLANIGTESDATVTFNGNSYHLPAWSISILPDCKNVAFNTAKINAATESTTFARQALKPNADSSEELGSKWSYIKEPIGISKADAFVKPGLLEQINTTADESDYLWYSLRMDIKGDETFLDEGSKAVLHVQSIGQVVYAFINGKLAGSGNGKQKISLDIPINLVTGKNTIDLLSVTVGLANYGAFFDLIGAGITGPVTLKSAKSGSSIDLSSQQWTYQVGLKGEDTDLGSGDSSEWVSKSPLPTMQPLIWYKTTFDAPSGNSVSSVKSGWYHVPRSWIKPSGNTLVLLEEMGGDPTKISFATKQTGSSLCLTVSQSHPAPVDSWASDLKILNRTSPVLSLKCPVSTHVITSINFASFGTPTGTCGSFSHGRCNGPRSLSIVRKACVGSRSCKVEVSTRVFGDPCRSLAKSLAVEASCS
ncbi:hypothetical protein F2Q69_00002410 [Brassica cretica]|uniref:Beta-galactosidase n=1 Tax=Brassica cretica TaxID=69181 RepID=A0A8S9P742_BRACR|nr:hypothetical protein F2Q69_00002410 [Brassica cretica]